MKKEQNKSLVSEYVERRAEKYLQLFENYESKCTSMKEVLLMGVMECGEGHTHPIIDNTLDLHHKTATKH